MVEFHNIQVGFSTKKSKKLLFETKIKTFRPGEMIALIGPNGAGKTTLFNSMLGNQALLKGQFLSEGKNTQQLDKNERAKWVSFVPSRFAGVNHLSVYDLIAMGRAPYTNVLNRLAAKDHEIVKKIIHELELEELAAKNTLLLSDGERQIAMIGKALAQETKMIVLDEPTAFLDYNNRKKILSLLRKIALQQQKIIFISSHDLSLCFNYCNRIIGIDTRKKTMLDFSLPFDEEKIIETVFGNPKERQTK